MIYLDEATKSQLVKKSQSSEKGKIRFNKRRRSRVVNKVRQFNSMDMNKLFKEDIVDVDIQVHGETNDYIVKISFGGFLEELRKAMPKDAIIDIRYIIMALRRAIDHEDVYVHCTCSDFKYRFSYWATVNKYTSGEPQYSNGKRIRNPNDTLGSSCKHVLLVLNNVSWVIKVASVINNYIKWVEKNYEKAYADIIYPAIYGKPYEEPVQTSMFDKDELETSSSELDKSNEYGVERTRFKPMNRTSQEADDYPPSKNQMSLFDDEE